MPAQRQRSGFQSDAGNTDDTSTGSGAPRSHLPSKTQRKATMHALQALGEALVGLDAPRLHELAAEAALPEALVDAILHARTISAWGARKRQLQYIGRLMREVDPAPIRRSLDGWAHRERDDIERQHRLEEWRDRLLAEPAALDMLAATYPKVDRAKLRALIAQARAERQGGGAPHAYRELFRALKAIDPVK